jgi:hypothetical protein
MFLAVILAISAGYAHSRGWLIANRGDARPSHREIVSKFVARLLLSLVLISIFLKFCYFSLSDHYVVAGMERPIFAQQESYHLKFRGQMVEVSERRFRIEATADEAIYLVFLLCVSTIVWHRVSFAAWPIPITQRNKAE